MCGLFISSDHKTGVTPGLEKSLALFDKIFATTMFFNRAKSFNV